MRAIVAMITLFTTAIVAAQPPAAPKMVSPAYKPVTDVAGLPRILLIGDSISEGYTAPVRKLLDGKANVHRIPTNGGSTKKGLTELKKWLGDSKWDVIHFNWGLHDLKFAKEGQREVEPDVYEKNLRELVKQLKATGATLVWCTTTPIPPVLKTGQVPRKVDDIAAYNAIAKKVMDENGIAVSDLYSYVLPRQTEMQLPQNVHFSSVGSAFLAKHVAEAIEAKLPKAKKD